MYAEVTCKDDLKLKIIRFNTDVVNDKKISYLTR